jgi:hypothetical protein
MAHIDSMSLPPLLFDHNGSKMTVDRNGLMMNGCHNRPEASFQVAPFLAEAPGLLAAANNPTVE